MAYYLARTIMRVWNKGAKSLNNDINIWRKDFAGAWIRSDCYGLRNEYGWGIAKIVPSAQGGLDCIDNLMPMHWKNIVAKGDNFPSFISEISSEGNTNVRKIKEWIINKDTDE